MARSCLLTRAFTAACLLTALAADARVFQQVGGRGSTLFRPDVAGRRAYETTMQINGTEAAVSVAALEGGLAAATRALGGGVLVCGDGIAAGRLRGSGRQASVLVLTPAREDRAVAVAVEQSDADRLRSRDAANADGATGIPGMPGSVLTCTMRNDDTRTALETRRATVASGEAAAYYDTTLRQTGWACLTPRAVGEGGLQVYVKGPDVCCVNVRPADPRGGCLVTVLRKPSAAN